MEIRYQIDGDTLVRAQLQTSGTRVRDAVVRTLWGLVTEARDVAIANAPVARKAWEWGATKRYGVGAIQKGIITYMQGDGIPRDRMVRLSRAQKERIRSFEQDANIVAAVFSGFYTGRFYETGFSGMVHVRGKSTAYGRAYTRTWNSVRRSYAKKYGAGPMDTATHAKFEEKARAAASRASDRSRKAYERKHTVRAHPFMAPAFAAIEGKVGSNVRAAVNEALNGR